MKEYDLILYNFPLLKKHRFELCKEVYKLKKAELLKLNNKEKNLRNKYCFDIEYLSKQFILS
jgi:hypothetical protein